MSSVPAIYLPGFSPKVFEGSAPNERAKGLRSCASLFAFGRTEVYQIKQEGSELIAVAKKTAEPSFLKTLLKVLALATLVLPLLCVFGELIYKKLNPIRIDVKIAQNSFEQLIQKRDWQLLDNFLMSPEFTIIPETGEGSIEWALEQLDFIPTHPSATFLGGGEDDQKKLLWVHHLLDKRLEACDTASKLFRHVLVLAKAPNQSLENFKECHISGYNYYNFYALSSLLSCGRYDDDQDCGPVNRYTGYLFFVRKKLADMRRFSLEENECLVKIYHQTCKTKEAYHKDDEHLVYKMLLECCGYNERRKSRFEGVLQEAGLLPNEEQERFLQEQGKVEKERGDPGKILHYLQVRRS